MKYFSAFSGYGGFELGIQKAYEEMGQLQSQIQRPDNSGKTETQWSRPECVGFSEIDKYAIQVYKKHFPEHKNYGDITNIDPKTLPDFDLFVGGFPCQAFSIAGKRRGFDDTRGTLFFDVARIIKEKQPKILVLENVKGLLSHEQGRTFGTILGVLDELRYDVEWQVLNAKDFGVPQNRERVFIIGHLRGTSGRKIFPIGEGSGQTLKQIVGGSQGYRVYDTSGLSVNLASQAGGVGAKTGLYVAKVDRGKGIYKLKETETSGTLTSTMWKGIDASGRTGVINKTVRSGGRGSITAKHNWDTHLIGRRIRRLTPTECERLMGLPDGWTDGVSDTQRYKLCGNGVVTNVVQAVIEKLYE